MADSSNAPSAIAFSAACRGPSYISKFTPPNMSTIRNGWACSRLMLSPP